MSASYRRVLSALMAVVLVFCFLGNVLAVSLKQTSWDELRRAARVVIAGTVLSLESEQTQAPAMHGVQTRMKLGEIQLLAGQTKSLDFEVVLPGGTIGAQQVRVAGAPTFKVGQRVVLFLQEDNGDWALVGHGLGVMRRSKDGAWVTPESPTIDGPNAKGIGFEDLVQQLAAPLACVSATAANSSELPQTAAVGGCRHGESESACVSGWWLVLLGLAAVLLVALRRKAGLFLVLVCAGGGSLSLWGPGRVCAASRGFVPAGPKWNLYAEVSGRVRGGEVLWLQGKGTTDLPDEIAFAVIEREFQQWEDIPESAIAFRKEGVTLESGQAIDRRNVVSFLEKGPRKLFDEFTLAITFMVSESGVFIDTDLVFNDAITWVVEQSEFSLNVVALHEIGHVLGLDHTADPADSMFPTARGVTILSAGDREGAVFLYPISISAPPLAFAQASPRIGAAPLAVFFSAGSSFSRVGAPLVYSWDFGDGSATVTDTETTYTYTVPGTYTATLNVGDTNGTASDTVQIIVGTAGEPLTVGKFAYSASLIDTGKAGRDKLSLSVGGVSAAPGDKIQVSVNGLRITAFEESALMLDSRGAFRGFANLGGKLSVVSKAKSRELSLSLSGATLGDELDPRSGMALAQLSGTGAGQIVINIEKQSGGSVVQRVDFSYSFVVKAGKSQIGVIEKTIQGKL